MTRLMSKDALIFDAEIIKAIPVEGVGRIEGIDYCEGWHDFPGMGISVICAYDCLEARFRVFCGDNHKELADLIAKRRWIIGFNSQGFDEPLLAACWNIHIPPEKSYDLQAQIWEAAGLGPIYQSPGHGGYSLDKCCRANLHGVAKSGDGAMAPIDWQRGRIGAVIDYCLGDVTALRLLIEGMNIKAINGMTTLKCPKTGKWLNVRLPGEMVMAP
ncbi:MAG: hypothetical protein KKD73_01720 [Proteobacteria bacterium]|nr:hypothetical protein [Pseudomonadota bacterium]MBU1640089.1 hypothetical protein [Pseudomonadota bacterium]